MSELSVQRGIMRPVTRWATVHHGVFVSGAEVTSLVIHVMLSDVTTEKRQMESLLFSVAEALITTDKHPLLRVLLEKKPLYCINIHH